jgi:hypothetical protein
MQRIASGGQRGDLAVHAPQPIAGDRAHHRARPAAAIALPKRPGQLGE